MNVYGDIDDLKRSLSLATSDTSVDDDLERALLAASGGIDEATGRSFGVTAEGETETRLYPCSEARSILAIDDLVELTSVRVDASGSGDFEIWTLDTDFRLEPLNAEVRERPWTSIQAMGRSFPSATLAVVEVVGRFGWLAPPPQIIQATNLLATQLFQRARSAPFGVVSVGGDIGGVAYIARNDVHISGLIRPFSRRRSFASLQLT